MNLATMAGAYEAGGKVTNAIIERSGGFRTPSDTVHALPAVRVRSHSRRRRCPIRPRRAERPSTSSIHTCQAVSKWSQAPVPRRCAQRHADQGRLIRGGSMVRGWK